MKLENFVMEQDLGDASVSDIVFEQAVADLNVISALLDCYEKHEVIVEYLEKNEIDSELYMEGKLGDVGKFLKGIGQTAGDKIKEKISDAFDKAKKFAKDKSEKVQIWFKNLIKMVIVAINKFIDSLQHVNFKRLADKVDNKFPDGKDFSNKINPILFWTISHSAQYTEKLLDYRKKDSLYAMAPQELKALYDKFIDEVQHVTGDGVPTKDAGLSKSTLISKLKQAEADQKKIVGVRTLITNLNLEEFDIDKDEQCRARIERAESMRKLYEEFAKAICKCYLDSAKEINKLVKLVASGKEVDVEAADMSKFASKGTPRKSESDDGDPNDYTEVGFDEDGNPVDK